MTKKTNYILSGEKDRNEKEKKTKETSSDTAKMMWSVKKCPNQNETKPKWKTKNLLWTNHCLRWLIFFSNRNEMNEKIQYIFIYENSFYALAVFSFVWLLIAILFYRETVSVRLTSVCKCTVFVHMVGVRCTKTNCCVYVWQTIKYNMYGSAMLNVL